MSKLSKRVDTLENVLFKFMKDSAIEDEILRKQMSCDCSEFEVNDRDTYRSFGEFVDGNLLFVGGDCETTYTKKCLSCGLETTYASEEDAMKDKDTLLKAKVLKLEAERKSLKDK